MKRALAIVILSVILILILTLTKVLVIVLMDNFKLFFRGVAKSVVVAAIKVQDNVAQLHDAVSFVVSGDVQVN